MNQEYAKVILDSVSPAGVRITTMEVRYWRMIHSEALTHRDRARNAASSRAIPFLKMEPSLGAESFTPIANCTYSKILNDPFTPEFIGTEQSGMQSGGELEGVARKRALAVIDEMRLFNLNKCKELFDLGVHKSIINRYVEPWSYITILMTATRWNNFFRLRIHPAAEKHFNKVAGLMRDALNLSVPTALDVGSWHLPYIRPEDWESPELASLCNTYVCEPIEIIKQISAARCARLSYLTQDGKRSLQADLNLFGRLLHPLDQVDDPPHCSPLENVAQCHADKSYKSGPFHGWHQLRKSIPNEDVP